MARLPVYFVSHGGGPWPWMKDGFGRIFQPLQKSLEAIAAEHSKPKAVVMVTAHWEGEVVKLSHGKNPGMLYDYYGFPENTYRVKYPAPGAPELAEQVAGLLAEQGIDSQFDEQRGYDHGTFVVAAVMYPKADIPVLQMSLKAGLDPLEHLKIGEALQALRDQDVLIIGSGSSFHNLGYMNRAGAPASAAFDQWLQNTVVSSSAQTRFTEIQKWKAAPAARICHPREEHLLPLMVAIGAGGEDQATCVFHDNSGFGGIVQSSFRFG